MTDQTQPLTEQQLDLDAIEARIDAVPEGPWHLSDDLEGDGYPGHLWVVRTPASGPDEPDEHCAVISIGTRALGEFIAAMDPETAKALVAEVRRLQDRIARAHQAMAERLTEVAEREADGMLPFGTPGASWCDAVTVTCARIEDALRDLPEPQHTPARPAGAASEETSR